MNKQQCWESFKAEAATVADRLKKLIQEGNVRRIVVEHKGHTVAEFPVTAGVVGLVIAPVLAAIAAMVALLKECTIHVEKAEPAAAARAGAAKAGVHTPIDAEC